MRPPSRWNPLGDPIWVQFLIGAVVCALAYGAFVYAVNQGHTQWCARQWRVASTHTDTVSTTRWCGDSGKGKP
jgi:hypothetical protein